MDKADELLDLQVRAMAAVYGLSVAEVLAALDRHPIELDRDKYLRRTLAMELIELDQLATAFRSKALKDRDPASAAILLKIAERRATLLGMNAPLGHAVQIVQHEPAEYPSSTEQLRRALERIQGRRLPKPDDSADLDALN